MMNEWDLLYISYEVSKSMILSSAFFAIILTSLQTKDLCSRPTLSGSKSVMHLAAWSLAESQALLVSHVVETTLRLHWIPSGLNRHVLGLEITDDPMQTLKSQFSILHVGKIRSSKG